MRFSTEDGDEIEVHVEFGEVRDETDEQPEFDQITVSIHKNEIEGRIRSTTDDELIADLGRKSRPVRIEARSADGTEQASIEARVGDPSGQLEITEIE
ncbi:hypothetical protein [Halalkalicoccus ordinarius]|uniref:hypothetical protein n=1 Tax=Halalkalicoccus ordinarius TaxID=3116651 RepID=UPI00300F7B30